jgi:4-hydroxybenzoate polyprenyltransferase
MGLKKYIKNEVGEKYRAYLDLIRWNRPVGWLLLIWPTLSALWLAAGGFPGWHLLTVFCLGTVLMRSAGCCINDVADRAFDRHVSRTRHRPVTAGRLTPGQALYFGMVLALMAFALVLTTNDLTIMLSFAALGVTILYPYTKRFFAMPQAVLGIAFGFGIWMAFAAVQGHIPLLALGLWGGNLFWVLAYDTQYAMADREDDQRLGLRTSAITLGHWDISACLGFEIIYIFLWGVCLWPLWTSLASQLVFIFGLFVAVAQVGWHFNLIRHRQAQGCLRAFRMNQWLGATFFFSIVGALAWR